MWTGQRLNPFDEIQSHHSSFETPLEKDWAWNSGNGFWKGGHGARLNKQKTFSKESLVLFWNASKWSAKQYIYTNNFQHFFKIINPWEPFKIFSPNHLYFPMKFSRAAITELPQITWLKATEICCLKVLVARNLVTRCWQDHALCEGYIGKDFS